DHSILGIAGTGCRYPATDPVLQILGRRGVGVYLFYAGNGALGPDRHRDRGRGRIDPSTCPKYHGLWGGDGCGHDERRAILSSYPVGDRGPRGSWAAVPVLPVGLCQLSRPGLELPKTAMCTVTFIPGEAGVYHLTSNRDEHTGRARALPPRSVDELVYPRDG